MLMPGAVAALAGDETHVVAPLRRPAPVKWKVPSWWPVAAVVAAVVVLAIILFTVLGGGLFHDDDYASQGHDNAADDHDDPSRQAGTGHVDQRRHQRREGAQH
jgi:hypothetical protein